MVASRAVLRTALVVMLLTPLVMSHGGGHIVPAGGAKPAPSAPPAPPVAGGPAVPAPPIGTSSTPGGGARPGRSRTGARGGSGRGSSNTGTGFTLSHDGWEFWWEHNDDRFLDLKARLVDDVTTSGAPMIVTGLGRRTRTDDTRRPSYAEISELLIPALRDLVADSDDKDILDSAILALGRMSREDRAGSIIATARPLLRHPVDSVRTSATLALGVLGSPSARFMLRELLIDSPMGRRLVKESEVPRMMRAYAGLALGLIDAAEDVPLMLAQLDELTDADRDVKVGIIVGLGQMANASISTTIAPLSSLLGDRSADATVLSFIPTTLGKIGDRTALPALIAVLHDEDANRLVRQSAAMGLGRLATLRDGVALDVLHAIVDDDRDAQTRHYALISLAKIAASDLRSKGQEATERVSALVELFAEQVLDPDRRDHRSWAALGAAMLGRARPAVAASLAETVAIAYLRERDPSYKSAFALSLGLLGKRDMAPKLLEDFERLKDTDFRGYAAMALGFLGHVEAVETLRAYCADKSTEPSFRLKAAVGLALLRDEGGVSVLGEMLAAEPTMGVREAATKALGLTGDRTALDPLMRIVLDADHSELTRAFACVALGIVAEKSDLSWNTAISEDNNYLATVDVVDQVLRIL